MIHVLARPAALAALLLAVPTVAFAQSSPPPAATAPTGGRMMMRAPWMQSLDTTKPISFQQFQTAALGWFDQVDTNHDGTITPDERRAWMTAHMPAGAAPGSGGGGERRRMPGGANPNAESLTRADFQSRLQQQFDAIDTNHDGTITPDEMQAAAERRRHFRQPE